MKPGISIIIPLFNKGRFILPALQMFSPQSAEDHEIIVAADRSKDDGAGLTRTFFAIGGTRSDRAHSRSIVSDADDTPPYINTLMALASRHGEYARPAHGMVFKNFVAAEVAVR